jgi:hypothetical protein
MIVHYVILRVMIVPWIIGTRIRITINDSIATRIQVTAITMFVTIAI